MTTGARGQRPAGCGGSIPSDPRQPVEAVGPPRRPVRRGTTQITPVQRLNAAHTHQRGAHLLCRALPRERGVGAVHPRSPRDGQLPPDPAGLRRPLRAGLVGGVSRDLRRRPRHRLGIRRGDPRRRVLQARGRAARAPGTPKASSREVAGAGGWGLGAGGLGAGGWGLGATLPGRSATWCSSDQVAARCMVRRRLATVHRLLEDVRGVPWAIRLFGPGE